MNNFTLRDHLKFIDFVSLGLEERQKKRSILSNFRCSIYFFLSLCRLNNFNIRKVILFFNSSLLTFFCISSLNAQSSFVKVDPQFSKDNQCRWEGYLEGKELLKERERAKKNSKTDQIIEESLPTVLTNSPFEARRQKFLDKFTQADQLSFQKKLSSSQKEEDPTKNSFIELDKQILDMYNVSNIKIQLIEHASTYPDSVLSSHYKKSVDSLENQNLFGYPTSFFLQHQRHHLLKSRTQNWIDLLVEPSLNLLNDPTDFFSSIFNSNHKLSSLASQKLDIIFQSLKGKRDFIFKNSYGRDLKGLLDMEGHHLVDKTNPATRWARYIGFNNATEMVSSALSNFTIINAMVGKKDFKDRVLEEAAKNSHYKEKHLFQTQETYGTAYYHKYYHYCYFSNPIYKAYQLKNPNFKDPKNNLLCQGLSVEDITHGLEPDLKWFEGIYELEKNLESPGKAKALEKFDKILSSIEESTQSSSKGSSLFNPPSKFALLSSTQKKGE